MTREMILSGILIIASFSAGCSSNFKQFIQNKADSAIITCYNSEKAKTIKISSPEKINSLLNFISNKSSPFYKCGYNGSIIFLKNNKSILTTKIEFNTHPGCAHFLYIYKDTVIAKQITDSGLKSLSGLCGED